VTFDPIGRSWRELDAHVEQYNRGAKA
jgi:hypothetical protein